MTVTFIPGKSGNYQCLSTDMSGSLPVDDMSWIGANLFVTDTGEWYRVDENLYLVPMTYPITGSISAIVNGSDIQIGAVEIKDADTDNRVKVVQGSSITVDDMAMAVHDAGTVSASLVAGGSTVFVEDQNISCTGFVSSVTNDDLDPWITTTSASQVINFPNTLNDLKIYSSSSALYVQLNSGSHCVYVPANSDLEISGYKIDSITFSGASPVDFRYYGQYN